MTLTPQGSIFTTILVCCREQYLASLRRIIMRSDSTVDAGSSILDTVEMEAPAARPPSCLSRLTTVRYAVSKE